MRGETLIQRLQRRPMSVTELAPIVDDVLVDLAAFHARHVIHRALTPESIFIEGGVVGRPRTRLVDFGVLKSPRAAEGSEPDLAAFDATLGSFSYMAPEQVRGSVNIDERIDIYAMGAVVFRALSGRVPFEGANALTLIALKLDQPAPSLKLAMSAPCPDALDRFVAKMMARDRDERFATATEARAAWRRITLD